VKRTLLSILAILSIGTSTMMASDNDIHFGFGYASTNINVTVEHLSNVVNNKLSQSTNTIMLLAGYNFNDYLGLESRYYFNTSSIAFDYGLNDYKVESFTLYLKPQYPFGVMTVYGLVGVSLNTYTVNSLLGDDNSDALLSWGGGAKFNVTQSLGLFVDYTDLGDSTNFSKTNLSSWNLGASYKF